MNASENDSPGAPATGGLIQIDKLPKTILQNIYHTVTGKTENLSKDLHGSVIINADDIDHLYAMINDQRCLYDNEFDPTVTVVVKHATERSVTYSSWARFKALSVGDHEITSEITIKMEFVLRLPQTQGPQRCVVSINLDSSLPLIRKRNDESMDYEQFGFFVFISREWRAVKVSIDFVDFLVAKSFSGVVEEWFSRLRRTKTNTFQGFILGKHLLIRNILNQMGRIGMAIFLAAYVYFSGEKFGSLRQETLGVSLGLVIWSLSVISEHWISSGIFRRIAKNIVPAVILLTSADRSCFAGVEKMANSQTKTVLGVIGAILGGIAINILASFIYAMIAAK